jgi:hypothetical protein
MKRNHVSEEAEANGGYAVNVMLWSMHNVHRNLRTIFNYLLTLI